MPLASKHNLRSIGICPTDREQILLARLPKPITTIRQQGNEFLATLLQELFRKIDDTLFDLAKNATKQADQDQFFAAMREIRGQQDVIQSTFIASINTAYGKLAQVNGAADALVPDIQISANELSLVSFEELDELVAKESISARAHATHRRALKELSQRIDSIALADVDENNLPVCPRVLSDLFVAAVHGIDIDTKSMMVIFKVYETTLLNNLGILYKLQNELLKERGVLPSLNTGQASKPKVKKEATEYTSGANAAVDTEILAMLNATSAAFSNSARDIDRAETHPNLATQNVFADMTTFGPEYGPNTRGKPGGSAAGSSRPGAADDIYRHHLRQLLQPQPHTVDGASPFPEPASPGNLLDQLFHKIRLVTGESDQLSTVLGQLQGPISRLAMHDQGFFYNSNHSARNFINRTIAALLQCDISDGEHLAVDPLYQKINAVIRTLDPLDRPTELDFDNALMDIEQFQIHEGQRSKIVEKRSVSAEFGRYKNEQALAFIDHTIAEVCQEMVLLSPIKDIIQNGWKYVMNYIALKFSVDSSTWDECIQTLIDLVVETQERVSKNEAVQSEQTRNQIKQRLKVGFETIHFDIFKTETMLNSLEKVFSNLAPTSVSQPQPEIHKKSVAEVKIAVEEQIHPHPEQADTVLQPFLNQAKSLGRGSWFNLAQDQTQIRCRLAAVIENYEKFIFVSRLGTKICDLNLIQVARKLQEQTLIPMDSNQIFDKALEEVIMTLKREPSQGGMSGK